jgi:peptidoglycan/xylan/chitin deacetylase (PgdA/CDA1 family)
MHRALRPAVLTLSAAALAVTLAACGGSVTPRAQASSTPAAVSTSASPTPSAAPVDPASVHANELGLVPVLMYHQLTDKPTSVYDRRPADFKAELEQLAADGCVPITAADFVQGRIDIPAGKHPVVLTFDDSTLSQFALGPDGDPKPGTAVAILEQVAAEHPGFTPTASFFVNNDPFTDADGRTALGWLHDHGFDIGDHTVDHANLRQVSAAKVQQEIADNYRLITSAVPGFTPLTMALPFGAYPQDAALAHQGSSGGTSYAFKGVFLVGAGPSHSPFHVKFDPYNIPRIRSQSQAGASAADKDFISSYYLPWLKAHPESWYTSDGDPAKVSFPKAYADVLAPTYKGEANPY